MLGNCTENDWTDSVYASWMYFAYVCVPRGSIYNNPQFCGPFYPVSRLRSCFKFTPQVRMDLLLELCPKKKKERTWTCHANRQNENIMLSFFITDTLIWLSDPAIRQRRLRRGSMPKPINCCDVKFENVTSARESIDSLQSTSLPSPLNGPQEAPSWLQQTQSSTCFPTGSEWRKLTYEIERREVSPQKAMTEARKATGCRGLT